VLNGCRAWCSSRSARTLDGIPSGLPSNSGLRSANIEASFACLVAYSSSYSGTRPHRNGASKPITLHRTRLELIVERKIRRRQLTDDGNVEITGRDLRERAAATVESRIGYWRVAP
jgi:hypothetical protein